MSDVRSDEVNASPAAAAATASEPGQRETHACEVTAAILAQLRKELSLTSRRAGMAEVATGTLHNVGNVLNSISVSAGLVTAQLRDSRVGHLSKALGLLREHRQDVASYLTSDPKGKMLPSYLETLAEHFAAEQASMLKEMEDLGRNLEHIKEIVAMQQSYAKMCGVVETLPVSELVEDALRMNLGAFQRHGITIIRQFTPVSPVTVDKHKVLQILINLMRNAKYAMDEAALAEKRLTLTIAPDSQGQVLVSVRDNGIGIAPENLKRIFDHGFTTKRDGHGFGLHSGAQAARELGGRLTAYSDGLGKGALFCLQLPAAHTQPDHPNHNHANPSVPKVAQSRS
jgi:signal transduction histidine kinase